MNQYSMLFVQTYTPALSMHQKLTKHEKSCMQNDQLPTCIAFKLNENSDLNTMMSGLVCVQ